MIKLNADQLRSHQPSSISHNLKKKLQRNDIYIILDNVLDTYNIGSVFRLADAVAAKKVYLCGGTETPPNHRIKKASINTTEWVDWQYFEKTADAIKDLRINIKDIQIIAIEQAKNSTPYDQLDYQLPVALIVGHESDGVSEYVLALCDSIVELPMFGVNISLNVMVSLGIVLYEVIEKTKKTNISID
jgi:23S rRNA (guanosine2251-2'-O)-methyltransferase